MDVQLRPFRDGEPKRGLALSKNLWIVQSREQRWGRLRRSIARSLSLKPVRCGGSRGNRRLTIGLSRSPGREDDPALAVFQRQLNCSGRRGSVSTAVQPDSNRLALREIKAAKTDQAWSDEPAYDNASVEKV